MCIVSLVSSLANIDVEEAANSLDRESQRDMTEHPVEASIATNPMRVTPYAISAPRDRYEYSGRRFRAGYIILQR